MLINKRHEEILLAVNRNEIISVKELVDITNTSESTIRRDLVDLEKKDLLVRVHGGAARVDNNFEASVESKTVIHSDEKELIAKYAAEVVVDGDYIFLDAGSTTFRLIKYLDKKKVTVVTNGITHIPELMKYRISTYIIGGLVKDTTSALVGKTAHETLREYHFTKAFIGVNSLSIKGGYTTPDPEESMLKELAMKNSDKVFVLADSSKFNRNSFSKFGDLNQAIIITDRLLDKDYLKETEVRELII